MKKNNILISAYCVDKSDVGEARMAYEWIVRLGKKVNLTVITAGSRINKNCGLEENSNIDLVILKPKFSFKWFDSFDRAVHPGYIEFFQRAKKRIPDIIKQKNISLCHHLAPRSLRYPAPFIHSDVPFIAGPFHGGLMPPAIMKELGHTESLLFSMRALDNFRMKYDPLLKLHYRKAARLIVSAPYVADLLLQDCQNKTRVIYGVGIDSKDVIDSYQRVEKDTVDMVFVGRLEPSKGLELLLYAIAEIRSKNINLAVYGKGSCSDRYKKLACDLGINDKIKWLGFKSNVEVVHSYQQKDIFVLPSLKEPAGIAVIEAMASGLPVICVDAGGPAYSVNEECGIKIPLGNKNNMVKGLARAIDDLVSSKNKRVEMGRNAIKRVKQEFTWDVVVGKMLNLYDEVINEQ